MSFAKTPSDLLRSPGRCWSASARDTFDANGNLKSAQQVAALTMLGATVVSAVRAGIGKL